MRTSEEGTPYVCENLKEQFLKRKIRKILAVIGDFFFYFNMNARTMFFFLFFLFGGEVVGRYYLIGSFIRLEK